VSRQDEYRAAKRNLEPHAEAIAAMTIWSREYAHEQRGGSMDFWDSLSDSRKRICFELVEKIRGTKSGRMPVKASQ
jgi:hypothetical protein